MRGKGVSANFMSNNENQNHLCPDSVLFIFPVSWCSLARCKPHSSDFLEMIQGFVENHLKFIHEDGA